MEPEGGWCPSAAFRQTTSAQNFIKDAPVAGVAAASWDNSRSAVSEAAREDACPTNAISNSIRVDSCPFVVQRFCSRKLALVFRRAMTET
jgi:hypothetical protein